VLLWSCFASSEFHNHKYWADYESGALGQYPQVTYASSKISTPLVHVSKWDERCDADGFVLISPHGERIADNKLLLLDYKGNLVWYGQENGSIHNIQVQKYRGDKYITYWVGDDEFYGHGAGFFKMVSSLTRFILLLVCAKRNTSLIRRTHSHILLVLSTTSMGTIMNSVLRRMILLFLRPM